MNSQIDYCGAGGRGGALGGGGGGGGRNMPDSGNLLGPNPSPKQERTHEWAVDNYMTADSGISSADGNARSRQPSIYSAVSTGSGIRNDLVYGSETCSSSGYMSDGGFGGLDSDLNVEGIIPDSISDALISEMGILPSFLDESIFRDGFGDETLKAAPSNTSYAPGPPGSVAGDSGIGECMDTSTGGPSTYGGCGAPVPPSWGPPPDYGYATGTGPTFQNLDSQSYELTPLRSPMSVEQPTPSGDNLSDRYGPTSVCPPSVSGAGEGPPLGPSGCRDRLSSANSVTGMQTTPHNSHSDSREDFQLLTDTLPEILRFLEDPDAVVVLRSAKLLKDLAHRDGDGYLRAMLSNDHLVGCLLRAAQQSASSPDSQLLCCLLTTLYSLSVSEVGCRKIVQANGVTDLVNYLTHPNHRIVFIVVPMLNNILLKEIPGVNDAIRSAGGLEKLLVLLQSNNPKVLALVLDNLTWLVRQHQQSKTVIYENGGTALVVRIMSMPDEIFSQNVKPKIKYRLILHTLDFLKVLSATDKLAIKKDLVSKHLMQYLYKQLHHPQETLILKSLLVMRNFSDQANKEPGLACLLETLVAFLKAPSSLPVKEASVKVVLGYSVDILANLTASNEENKATVIRSDGLKALLETIVYAQRNAYLPMLDSAVISMRNLTACAPGARGGPDNSHLQQQVGEYLLGLQALPLLLCMLPVDINALAFDNESWILCFDMLSLVQNLSSVAACRRHEAMRDKAFLQRLARCYIRAVQDLSNGVEFYQRQSGSVGVMKIRDSAYRCMRNLAQEPEIAHHLNQFCPAVLQGPA